MLENLLARIAMPIEFVCPNCEQMLRVPDEAAGKSARCPICSVVNAIPATIILPTEESLHSFSDDIAEQPYESPDALPQDDDYLANVDDHYDRFEKLDPLTALSLAGPRFVDNAGLLIGAYLAKIAMMFLLKVATVVFVARLQGIHGENAPMVLAMRFLTEPICGVANLFLWLGLIRINLDVARGLKPKFNQLFSGGGHLVSAVLASIVFTVVTMMGVVFLIIPGVFMALSLWTFLFFIVDRNVGFFEAIELAWQHASGNRLVSLLLFILNVGIMFCGFLALGFGIFVAGPFLGVVNAVAYLMITRQPISIRR